MNKKNIWIINEYAGAIAGNNYPQQAGIFLAFIGFLSTRIRQLEIALEEARAEKEHYKNMTNPLGDTND